MRPTQLPVQRPSPRCSTVSPRETTSAALRSLLRIAVVVCCSLPVAAGLRESTDLAAVRATEASSVAPIPEYKIKAAFLYNFVRYTTWPKSAFAKKDTPIELLIVGEDPFGNALRGTFDGKLLHGRKVLIRHMTSAPKETTAHLIFTTGLVPKERDKLLALCAKQPILLIGEEPGLATRGACANFYVEKKRVRFEVNNETVKANQLTISSELLKLARIVKSKKGGER